MQNRVECRKRKKVYKIKETKKEKKTRGERKLAKITQRKEKGRNKAKLLREKPF